MQEQCKVCLHGQFCSDLFSQISLSLENGKNKLLTKMFGLQ